MRMLAGARTALQTKRASRSQLSQVHFRGLSEDNGKRFSAGSSYGSREGGGGFGGRRDQKDSNRRRFGKLSQISKRPLALQRRVVF